MDAFLLLLVHVYFAPSRSIPSVTATLEVPSLISVLLKSYCFTASPFTARSTGTNALVIDSRIVVLPLPLSPIKATKFLFVKSNAAERIFLKFIISKKSIFTVSPSTFYCNICIIPHTPVYPQPF